MPTFVRASNSSRTGPPSPSFTWMASSSAAPTSCARCTRAESCRSCWCPDPYASRKSERVGTLPALFLWQPVKKSPPLGGGLKPLERGREERGRDARLVGLLVDRRAADLVVLQDAAGVAELEGGDLFAFFEGDHDAVVGGMGGGGGEQCGHQQALEDFGGVHFVGLRVAFLLIAMYGGAPWRLIDGFPRAMCEIHADRKKKP